MDDIYYHLAELYGLTQNHPLALQFPRLPPGISHPVFGGYNAYKKNILKNEDIKTKLEDFRLMYHSFASELLYMGNHNLIPPGHPLFNRQNSIEILKLENSKLQKENSDLKKQLENLSKQKA